MKRETQYIVGNWKMNPATPDEAKRIYKKAKQAAQGSNKVKVIVLPAALYIDTVTKLAKDDAPEVGIQNGYPGEIGAFTGEISFVMAKNMGLTTALIGHSERRAAGESAAQIAEKARAALEAGLRAIVCVGEKTRDADGSHIRMIEEDMRASLAGISGNLAKKLIIAYEPIWAIGSKEAMTPVVLHETAILIRRILIDILGDEAGNKVPILYGGSVNARNAYEIVVQGGVSGLLVGRESVNETGFAEIIKLFI